MNAPAMSSALFRHPDVVKVIRAVLMSKGISHEDPLADGIADVIAKAHARVMKTGRPPADVKEAIPIVRSIAEKHTSGMRRDYARGKKVIAGPTGEADEHAPESIGGMAPSDAKRIVQAVVEELAAGGAVTTLDTLHDIGAGVPQNELADEQGISPAALRKRVQTTRERVIERLTRQKLIGLVSAGVAIGALGIAIFFFVRSHNPEQEAQHTPAPAPSAVPSQVPVVVMPTPEEREARQYRDRAKVLCARQSWGECGLELDTAKMLDPKGEDTPEVKAERAAIDEGEKGWDDPGFNAKPRQ